MARPVPPGKKGPEPIRLNRYLANAGVGSRRQADELIKKGQVTVNGKVVTELGVKVMPSDKVAFKGKSLSAEKPVYLLLNKPKDFITTASDPQGRRTVLDLVKNQIKERIYPVGRLDRLTTGLLLLTNDGDLAKQLSHPSSEVKKVYYLTLDKPLTKKDFTQIMKVTPLDDGPFVPDALAPQDEEHLNWGIELHSGRNRIIRRLFEHYGYKVKKLDRVIFAGLDKKDLPRGKWRRLTQQELVMLKYLKGGKKKRQ